MIKITETITSPNQSNRGDHIPKLIALHIADGTYEGTKAWFSNSASQTSSNFVVGQDGRICQCVPLVKMAWCNGTTTDTTSTKYFGYSTVPLVKQLGGNANQYSVSIELEGYYSKTQGALTETQLNSLVELIKDIQTQVLADYKHTIPFDREHIVGHYEINPKTKPNCPGQLFPWSELMERLNPTGAENENVAYVTRVAYNENYEYAKSNLAKAKAAGFSDAYIQVVERINASGE